MKRKFRAVSAIVVALTALAMTGLFVPAASAADLELRWVSGQPQDTEAGQTIRTADLNTGSGDIQIGVFDIATDTLVTNFNKPISFRLATSLDPPQDGISAAVGTLDVEPQFQDGGIATFGVDTLRILTENEPQFTDYSLVPISLRGPSLPAERQSDGFDIWEDGNSCVDGVDAAACEATLVPGNGTDKYTLKLGDQVGNVVGSLGASELFDVLPFLDCPGQDLIFENQVFSYATSESDGTPNAPVQLVNHITKKDWKASANNGQAHADWCIGLLSNQPWLDNGADSTLIDTNGPLAGGELYVALAPKCPQANPQNFAPCIVSQTGDGNGGSITTGWLPGGDPPRRT